MNWKPIVAFFALFAYLIGTIGGFGSAAYAGEWFIAICIVVLAIMAFPKAKECWKRLTE